MATRSPNQGTFKVTQDARDSAWSPGTRDQVGGFIMATEAELLPFVQSEVIIHSVRSDGGRRAVLDDGKFHIWIWCSPGSSNHAGNPGKTAKLWSHDWDGAGHNWNCWGLTGEGQAIRAPEGMPVAEYFPDNLYILIPLDEGRMTGALEIYTEILRVVAQNILGSMPGVNLDEKMQHRRLSQFVQAMSRETLRQLRQLTEHEVAEVAAIADLRQNLRRRVRESGLRNHQLAALQQHSNPAAMEAKALEVVQQIMALPQVLGISVPPGNYQFEVLTDNIYCRNSRTGRLHDIGKMRIVFDLHRGTVQWFNLTRVVKERAAPHVIGRDGSACLGNTAEAFSELLASYDLLSATMLAINFVSSANMDDQAGQSLPAWPEVSPEEEAAIRPELMPVAV